VRLPSEALPKTLDLGSTLRATCFGVGLSDAAHYRMRFNSNTYGLDAPESSSKRSSASMNRQIVQVTDEWNVSDESVGIQT